MRIIALSYQPEGRQFSVYGEAAKSGYDRVSTRLQADRK